MIKEFKIKRSKGTLVMASLKLLKVGFWGTKFKSMVNSSPEGINAMLTAYKRGSSTTKAKTKLAVTQQSCAGSALSQSLAVHLTLQFQKLFFRYRIFLFRMFQNQIFALYHEYFTPFFSMRNITSVISITMKNRITD